MSDQLPYDLPELDVSLPQELLKDILREETRKERRNLLAASAVGIVIVKAGLIPTKISALGIDFSQTDQRTLLWVLLGVTAYFLAMFVVYALSDILAFWVALGPKVHDHWLKHTRLPDETFAEHVYWKNGKRYTQVLRDMVVSKDALVKFGEWYDLLHQIQEMPQDREERYRQLIGTLEEIKGKISELETSQQPADDSLISEFAALESQLEDFMREEELRVAHLKEEAELVNKEANTLGRMAGERRDYLFKNLFKYVGSSTLITIARLGMDFIVPLAVSIFTIVSLYRGR